MDSREPPAGALSQVFDEAPSHSLLVLGFALPDDQNPPAELPKRLLTAAIAGNVPFEFCGPERRSSLGNVGVLASPMPMPEASVDEYRQTVPRKDQIRTTGEIPAVQAETEAEPVSNPTDNKLGSGITSPDFGHDFTSPLLVHNVRHRSALLTPGR